jgi:gliding motility-associated-like protein
MVITGGVPPAISISSSANNICYGTAVQFDAIVTDAGNNSTLQWKLNGADVGTNTTSYNNSKLKNGDVIQCLIKPGSSACSLAEILSLPVTMSIYDTTVIRINPNAVTIKYMETIGLSTNSTGTIRSFQWTPADQLQNPQSLNPVTIPLTATTNFTLTVINSNGCVSKSQAIVKVSKPLDLMPNAFTPNGDGKNDVFRIPPGYSIELSDFSVFDRWGNLVFTTKDISKGWDGTVNGKKSPPGAYSYYIKGTYEGKPINIKSNIVLIR